MVAHNSLRIAFSPSRLLGGAVSLCGLLVDAAIGLAILRGSSPWIALLHAPAVLTWFAGICFLYGGNPRQEVRALLAGVRRLHRTSRTGVLRDTAGQRDWNARILVFTLLGLISFPGFGPIGCLVAIGLTALPFMIRRQRPAISPEREGGPATLLFEKPASPLLDLSIQPLVDVVHAADARQRRAAIQLLGQQFDHEAVHLLRGLLHDPDPDVRSEASVTLFRFEDLLARRVNEAMTQVREAPTAAHYAALAESYSRLVRIGLLDEPSTRYYRSLACEAYEATISLAPDDTTYWVDLARIRRDLGDSVTAMHTLNEVLRRQPNDMDAILLRMEIAFAERRWELLMMPPRPLATDTGDASPITRLLHWWAGVSNGEDAAVSGPLGAQPLPLMGADG